MQALWLGPLVSDQLTHSVRERHPTVMVFRGRTTMDQLLPLTHLDGFVRPRVPERNRRRLRPLMWTFLTAVVLLGCIPTRLTLASPAGTALWLSLVAVSLTVMLTGLVRAVVRGRFAGLRRPRVVDHRRPADPCHLGDARAVRRPDGRGHAGLAAREAARPNGPDRPPGSGLPALAGPVPNLGVTARTHRPSQQLAANTARQTATGRLGRMRRRCRRAGRPGDLLYR